MRFRLPVRLFPRFAGMLLAFPGLAGAECPPSVAWSLPYSGPGRSSEVFYSVAVDREGGAIAAGFEVRTDLRQGKNWLVVKSDRSGRIFWTTSYDDPSGGDDVAQAVAVDETG